MSVLITLPVLGLALIVQTAILSRINLLSGSADLMLLIVAAWGLQKNAKWKWIWAGLAGVLVGYVSGLPMLIPLAGYLLVMGLARWLQNRFWQAPLLAMFVVTFTGTFVVQLLSYGTIWMEGNHLPLGDAFVDVILPSVLLNLLLSLLIHPLMRDLNHWLTPAEAEA